MSNIVYIVDDDPGVLGSTEMLLKAVFGFQCRGFSSAGLLLAEIAELTPGCILTDLHMPGMTGLELQAELSRRSVDWPVVFMTGRGDIPTVVRALKQGAVEFIEKPFCEARLRSALDAAFATLKDSGRDSNARIRSALRDQSIVPYYQPKFDLRTGALTGLEALLRWTPDLPQPDRCKAIHEAFQDKSLGRAISRRMLEGVMADLAGWVSDGIDVGHVSINASACDIEDGSFAEGLIGDLDAMRIPRSMMQVEVTETVTLDLQERGIAGSTLGKLNAAGIGIALDDFGTGFASLTHLQNLPVDVLKIDRSFVSTLPESSSASIVRAIIGLAKGLGKQVVAEGVETRAQAEFLRVSGCDHAQGFLFGKPIPAGEVPPLARATQKPGWGDAFGWSRRVQLAV